MSDSTAIESILNESRMFPPPADFAANAHVKSFEEYERIYAEAAADPLHGALEKRVLDHQPGSAEMLRELHDFGAFYLHQNYIVG